MTSAQGVAACRALFAIGSPNLHDALGSVCRRATAVRGAGRHSPKRLGSPPGARVPLQRLHGPGGTPQGHSGGARSGRRGACARGGRAASVRARDAPECGGPAAVCAALRLCGAAGRGGGAGCGSEPAYQNAAAPQLWAGGLCAALHAPRLKLSGTCLLWMRDSLSACPSLSAQSVDSPLHHPLRTIDDLLKYSDAIFVDLGPAVTSRVRPLLIGWTSACSELLMGRQVM